MIGFREPLVFGLGVMCLDRAVHLLIIERNEAIDEGINPTAPLETTVEDEEKPTLVTVWVPSGTPTDDNGATLGDVLKAPESCPTVINAKRHSSEPMPFVAVVSRLFKSSCALAAIFITFTYG